VYLVQDIVVNHAVNSFSSDGRGDPSSPSHHFWLTEDQQCAIAVGTKVYVTTWDDDGGYRGLAAATARWVRGCWPTRWWYCRSGRAMARPASDGSMPTSGLQTYSICPPAATAQNRPLAMAAALGRT